MYLLFIVPLNYSCENLIMLQLYCSVNSCAFCYLPLKNKKFRLQLALFIWSGTSIRNNLRRIIDLNINPYIPGMSIVFTVTILRDHFLCMPDRTVKEQPAYWQFGCFSSSERLLV